MAKRDYKELDKVLVKIGAEVDKTWKQFLSNHTHTGKLSKSIRWKIKDHVLQININKEAQYVDEGTKPGRMPPVDKIKKWATSKGINPWAVAMSIKKYGTKKYPFLYKYQEIFKKYEKELIKAGYNEIIKTVDDSQKNKNNVIKLKI